MVEGDGLFMDNFLKMKILADPSLAIGTELPAQLVGAFGANANPNVHLTGQDGSYNLDDINFTIKIVGLVLDEEQTEIPDLADFIGQEVNLKVKRSITGGNWSTICLPFAMTQKRIRPALNLGVTSTSSQSVASQYCASSCAISFL